MIREDKGCLAEYYDAFRPVQASEVLGIALDASDEFPRLPPEAAVMPWKTHTPQEQGNRARKVVRQESEEHGIELDIENGFTHFGPASEAKVDFEYERLRLLQASVSTAGLKRSDEAYGDIGARFLMDSSGAYCAVIRNGQHRAAVAAALSFDTIPIRFDLAPVKREEVDYWPQVRAGRITREGALAVFDRVMRGDPPPACQYSPSPASSDKYRRQLERSWG